MRRLTSCCKCVGLQKGTITIGILGIVLSVITIILVLTLNATDIKVHTIDFLHLPPLFVKIVIIFNLVMTIFISSLLIAGAMKRNRWLILPWIALGFVLAIGLFISILYTAIAYIIQSKHLAGSLILIFGLIVLAVYVYLWLVVFSFHQLIREEKSRGGPYSRHLLAK